MRRAPRTAVAVLLLAVVLVLAPTAAVADVALGADSVTATESGGEVTADVAVVNTGQEPFALADEVEVSAGCTVDVQDESLAPSTTTTVPLELDAACFDGAEQVRVDLDATGAGNGPLPSLTIKAPAEEDHDWDLLVYAALTGLVVGFGFLLATTSVWNAAVRERAGERTRDQAARVARYEQVKAVVDQVVPRLRWKELGEMPAYSTSTTVTGVEAGWSFKDSWVSNVTVGLTAVVALTSSADVFTALLGEKPEAALRLMAIAGLLSAVVIAVANVVVKMMGRTVSAVSVRGFLVSTSLVVGAATFQGVSIALAGDAAVDGAGVWVAWVAVVVVLGVVVAYGHRTARSILQKTVADAVDTGVPVIPPDAVTAWDAGGHPWAKDLVAMQVRQLYADWLAEGVGPTRETSAPDARVTVTGPSDWAREPARASLL